MDVPTLTAFFGWCTTINLCIYVVMSAALVFLRGLVVRFTTGWFGLSEHDVGRVSMQYLGNYKLAILVFCFTPWVALKML